MLTIQQILKKTGLTLHNFQSWRRNDSNLLPRPVAVDKRVIYFDDSILARIKFIQDRQAEGLTLAQIEELLHEELTQDSLNLPPFEVWSADSDEFMRETQEFLEKWKKPETCQAEILAALKLDPELSGPPTVFSLLRASRKGEFCPLQVFTSVIFNAQVHFTELLVDLYAEPQVIQQKQIDVADFGMLLAILGQELANRKRILMPETIPYLLFRGVEGSWAGPDFFEDALEVAKAMTPVFEGGRRFLVSLRERADTAQKNKQPVIPKTKKYRSRKKEQ